MKRLLILLVISAGLGLVHSAQGGEQPYIRGPFWGLKAQNQVPASPTGKLSRMGKPYKDYGPNYYGTGGFYGRENYGPGTGVYYRVPGGFGVYGY